MCTTSPGADEGFKAEMVGNLAFRPQQDIVEAMGASKEVVYNISKEPLHTGDTTESEDGDMDLPPLLPLPSPLGRPTQDQPKWFTVTKATDGSNFDFEDINLTTGDPNPSSEESQLPQQSEELPE